MEAPEERQQTEQKKPQSLEPSDNIPTFLSKTFEILENAAYHDTISWTKNGEGFVVKKVKEFSEKILPQHFRHNNYSSFVRQLNMYDFHKMRQDNQQNAFKNSLFKRNCRHLLKQIQRKDYKKNKELRVQIGNAPPVKIDRLQQESSSLSRELEVQMQTSRHFYNKSINTCETNRFNMHKQLEELVQLQNLIENGSLNPKGLYRVIDGLLKIKRDNGKTIDSLECFYDEWANFMAKKNVKWNALIPEEHKSHAKASDIKAISFPTWVNSLSSFPSTIVGSMLRMSQ